MGQLVGNLGFGAVLEGVDDDGAGVWLAQLWYGKGGETPTHNCITLGELDDGATATIGLELVQAARLGGVATVRAELVAAFGSASAEVATWDAAPAWARAGWVHHLRRGPALPPRWPQLDVAGPGPGGTP